MHGRIGFGRRIDIRGQKNTTTLRDFSNLFVPNMKVLRKIITEEGVLTIPETRLNWTYVFRRMCITTTEAVAKANILFDFRQKKQVI